MKSERQREAKELRAQGFEWAQQIQARADHDRTVILSEAQRAATTARGEGDAEANRTLADAFSQNPDFYSLYRSLQTYKGALANSAPTMVVSPDADFMRLLKSGPPNARGGEPEALSLRTVSSTLADAASGAPSVMMAGQRPEAAT